MVEEVTSLKKDFKQKENKYLEEFLDMKALKEKVEDKLFKQDQSLQTIHMLCIQEALTKEIKEIKEIFEELEAEVDQNAVNRKCDEIERKNLIISNDNLIVDCLSKEVFYIATNSELTVSRFIEMHDAHTVVQVCCQELKAELSKLNDKIQKNDHNELVKRFSNLEITRAKHIVQTTSFLTENENLKVQINEKMKCVTMNSVKPKVLAPGITEYQLADMFKKALSQDRFKK
nr:hypothetical protein [Tanacetum cinerariifolium]